MRSIQMPCCRRTYSFIMIASVLISALSIFFSPGPIPAATAGKGWYLDGQPLVQKEELIDIECYYNKTLTISAAQGTGTGSVMYSAKCFKENSGIHTGYIHWTVPPSFLQPGDKISLTMSASSTGNINSVSSGLIKANNGTLLEAYDTSARANTATYTIPEGWEGAKLELYVSFMAAGQHGNVTYNYVYKGTGTPPITPPPAAWHAAWPAHSLWSETGLANKITIEIKNGNVTGSYDYKDGKMDGTLSADGKTISGHWKQTNNSGRYTLTIADDGRSFSGKICYGEDDPLKSGWGWAATLIGQ